MVEPHGSNFRVITNILGVQIFRKFTVVKNKKKIMLKIHELILMMQYVLLQAAAKSWKSASTIYEFNAKDIDGNEVSLDKYR